ncbi:uncharacterized protein LOC122370416 [Amphibalanus amphitrite]|uniref:uncharacterized protein LOC122370416 n=1 Tax=Amphibalanus amphitrite TaxID=1232801 RepID=UPI001C8FA85A|nr:uncharacterized protein LOC122370416 [Amphibalanus amphitrite]
MNPLRGGVGPIKRQKGAASDAKKPPSRRRVVCGIDGCAYNGEYRLHARHRQLVHSGKRAEYANSSFGVGGRFRSWVQKPSEDQYVHLRQESPGAALRSEESSPPEETPQSCSPGQAASSPTQCATEPQVSSDNVCHRSEDVIGETTDNTESATCGGCCSVCGVSCKAQTFMSDAQKVLHVLEEKCRELASDAFVSEARKLVAKLDQKCTELPDKLPAVATEDVGEGEHISVLFRSGRSISTLQTASGGELMVDEEKGYLYCSVCVPQPKDEQRSRPGLFAYDFSLGSVFANCSVLPPRFKSLRDTVAKHFRSEGHKAMKKSRCESNERENALI